MANRLTERCSTSRIIREMQIKTIMIYQFTPARMAIINKSTKSIGKDVEKGERFCTIGDNADWCSHYRKQDGDTSKIKNGPAFRLSNPTSGNISKGTQNINSKEHKHPYIYCSVIYNHQDVEAAQVSNNR